ncbi:hypothetical protein GM661_04420 [Iocasia frigidifontis]|uniref:Uncharacterized protein n=1 Tax=Iocasia fonsfrigidae TaxID=2682810 RepID=A0A8A7KCZ4_9FIRM|nr:hypothetical protein [Iocasia fonsfrigidae]QTL97279.1 hypothetical protein GM661_04420 [Iocasia fonsfrigidae]
MNQNNNQAFQQNAVNQQMHAGPGLGQAYTQLQQGNQGNPNIQNLAQNKGLQNTSPGQSQYARNNNYYQPSIQQGGGVNQYGAKFSSGARDEDIGSAYYQSQPAQNAPQNNIRSQYTGNQPANMQYGLNNNTGQSQYAQNNNYYQPSIKQGGGVNQYGAKFSSGTRDEDIGSAYYQSQPAQNAPQNNIRSQYTGNQPANMQYGLNNNTGQSQYAQNNNYYQPSIQQGSGVNQYGAKFSSGTRDEDIGSAYYQSKQGF